MLERAPTLDEERVGGDIDKAEVKANALMATNYKTETPKFIRQLDKQMPPGVRRFVKSNRKKIAKTPELSYRPDRQEVYGPLLDSKKISIVSETKRASILGILGKVGLGKSPVELREPNIHRAEYMAEWATSAMDGAIERETRAKAERTRAKAVEDSGVPDPRGIGPEAIHSLSDIGDVGALRLRKIANYLARQGGEHYDKYHQEMPNNPLPSEHQNPPTKVV